MSGTSNIYLEIEGVNCHECMLCIEILNAIPRFRCSVFEQFRLKYEVIVGGTDGVVDWGGNRVGGYQYGGKGAANPLLQ